MTEVRKTPGMIYDEVLTNPRRLLIAHVFLGLIAAFAYWIRPGSVTVPLRWSVPHGADVAAIAATSVAWFPYVVSMIFCRSFLSSSSAKAAWFFIVCAIVITAASVVLNLNLVGMRNPLSPMLVSLLVALALVATSWVSSAVWASAASDY